MLKKRSFLNGGGADADVQARHISNEPPLEFEVAGGRFSCVFFANGLLSHGNIEGMGVKSALNFDAVAFA